MQAQTTHIHTHKAVLEVISQYIPMKLAVTLQAHNLKVVGSNPTPATILGPVTGSAVTGIFVSRPLIIKGFRWLDLPISDDRAGRSGTLRDWTLCVSLCVTGAEGRQSLDGFLGR